MKSRSACNMVGLFLGTLLALCALAASPGDAQASSCGGADERACCLGEDSSTCDSGLLEINGCSGSCTCGGFNPLGIESSSTCKEKKPCGGEGQRACCFDEGATCGDGLAEIASCKGGNCENDDYLCSEIAGNKVYSSGTCVKISECGGSGQRACCISERLPSCNEGLFEHAGVAGDVSCKDSLGQTGNFGSNSNGVCIPANYTSLAVVEPTIGWTAPATAPSASMKGFADLHMHILGNLGHGGHVITGSVAHFDGTKYTAGVASALSASHDKSIHPSHDLIGDQNGDGTKDGTDLYEWTGSPIFNAWPQWTSTTHQKAYYKWLERAWRGGLRLTVLHAVTNESLCYSIEHKDKYKGEGAQAFCKDSMAQINEQIEHARLLEKFIDEESSCPADNPDTSGDESKCGWFRIVETPSEARSVIEQGKMAVVLGIEVANLFNAHENSSLDVPYRIDVSISCPDKTSPAFDECVAQKEKSLCINAGGSWSEATDDGESTCSVSIDTVDTHNPALLIQAVQELSDRGITHIFPIHNFDNAYGAAATWMDVLAIANAYAEQRFWQIENCENDGYGFHVDLNVKWSLASLIGFDGKMPEFPNYQSTPSCNARGLTDRGKTLLTAMMDRGMIIDIDHMGKKSFDGTLEVVKNHPSGAPYPIVATHVQFFDRNNRYYQSDNILNPTNLGRHERTRTATQLRSIRDTGGMVAAMLKDDTQDTDLKGEKHTIAYSNPEHGDPIADDCRHSSKSWAQSLQYAIDTMEGPVALGSDFNGMAGQIGPRFGSDACGGAEAIVPEGRRQERIAQTGRIEYPFVDSDFGTFDQQITGYRKFDYNVDGVAHVGLYPDMVEDLRKIKLDNHYLDEFFCSAESYVRVWERAQWVSQGAPGANPDERGWSCKGEPLCGPGFVEENGFCRCVDTNDHDGDGVGDACDPVDGQLVVHHAKHRLGDDDGETHPDQFRAVFSLDATSLDLMNRFNFTAQFSDGDAFVETVHFEVDDCRTKKNGRKVSCRSGDRRSRFHLRKQKGTTQYRGVLSVQHDAEPDQMTAPWTVSISTGPIDFVGSATDCRSQESRRVLRCR